MGKVYQVYRVDSLTQLKVPIGTVQERRNQTRTGSNLMNLMKLARKLYGVSPEDQTRIVLGEELLA